MPHDPTNKIPSLSSSQVRELVIIIKIKNPQRWNDEEENRVGGGELGAMLTWNQMNGSECTREAGKENGG